MNIFNQKKATNKPQKNNLRDFWWKRNFSRRKFLVLVFSLSELTVFTQGQNFSM